MKVVVEKVNKNDAYQAHVNQIEEDLKERLGDYDQTDIEFELTYDEYESDKFWNMLNDMFEKNEVSFKRSYDDTIKGADYVYIYGYISRWDN